MTIDSVIPKDYPRLLEVWESAVRSTHDFLKAEDFAFYKSRLPLYFDCLDLYACKNEQEEILGFLGVAGSKIEMLFIDNEYRGKGIGKKLLDFAVNQLKAGKVDVNEQNWRATGFYTHFGFRITGRSGMDGEGKNYPILHLELSNLPVSAYISIESMRKNINKSP
jgi:putative acetyltransferase